MDLAHIRMKPVIVALGALVVTSLFVTTVGAADKGKLSNQSGSDNQGHLETDFGVGHPLADSSAKSISQAEALADPTRLVKLASGLKARVVATVPEAPNVDQIALWPNDKEPTHLIFCNEQEPADAGLLSVNLKTGEATTIVTGTSDCDPVRRAPWGTILFGEEAGGGPNGGRMYELIDPLNTRNVTLDRTLGTFSGGTGAQNLTPRPALGRLSFEGLAIFASGLVYYGDENRPSSGTPGGAYFKFVPTSPRSDDKPITKLSDSPLAAGKIYGLRLGLRSGGTDYGQGTQFGFGTWVPTPPAADPDLRDQAKTLKLTGYYRPEDLEIDRGAEQKEQVHICGNNTGNESDDQWYGETICISDGSLADAPANGAKPEVQLLVAGSPALAMPDNIAQQPGSGNYVIHEDADTTYLKPHNDDLWDCLPDGDDADLLTDGCVRIGTLNDLTAEWTGGIFDASGDRFFVSVQHNISGKGTIIEITGWK
jgi:secreted PhoX family phosphatase